MKKIIFFLAYFFQTTKLLRFLNIIGSGIFLTLVITLRCVNQLNFTGEYSLLWTVYPFLGYSLLVSIINFFSSIDIRWYDGTVLSEETNNENFVVSMISALILVISTIIIVWSLFTSYSIVLITIALIIGYLGASVGLFFAVSSLGTEINFSEKFKDKQKKKHLKIA
jgi:hypothetical protein